MVSAVLFITFFVLLVLNVPISICLGLSSAAAILYSGTSLTIVATNIYSGISKFLLLAIPFFVLSGNIMAKAGISTRLIRFVDTCVGHRKGGIANVCIIVACFFGAISGSGPATVAALGAVLIPAMVERGGFSAPFSTALMATASSIAIVIPPSIAFVVYASITGVSIGDMFMAGIVPGIVMALLMMVVVTIYAIKRHYPRTKFPTFHEFGHALKEGFLPLMAPIILLVGIYGGVFTPTESAAIVVLYSLFLDVVVYRELSLKKFIAILKETVRDSLTIALIIAGATFFGYVATRAKIPQMILTSMTSVVSSKVTLLLIINVFLLIVGCFLETASAITIVVPLILPLLTAYNINLTQFGIIMVLNLMIGLLTPPFGLVLFVISKIGHISIGRFSRALVPWLGALLAALLLVTFIPQLSLWFPTMLGMSV